MILRTSRLRTKLLASIISISCLLASATVYVVRRRTEQKVHADLAEAVRNSLVTFQNFQRQREATLARSARLMADLPTLRALMTTNDPATIQDGSADLWRMAGSDLFVLANRAGQVAALDTKTNGFTLPAAQASLRHSLAAGESRDWWYGKGHLYEVFLQPIYFGPPSRGVPLGVLAVGYEVGPRVAEEVSQVASSEVAFLYGGQLVVSTLPADQQAQFLRMAVQERGSAPGNLYGKEQDFKLGNERFVGVSVKLPPSGGATASLAVLKSYDKATLFLRALNRLLFGIGLAAVLAGIGLAFLISHTVTRPLDNLVAGVRALEKGDFNYPLLPVSKDEVGELTRAFDRMRESLLATQNELLHAERLATMGRMASAISHDLRHPLTAILAYSEFLSEARLSEAQRRDFYGEIRQAVNRMSDLIDSLLEFSKSRQSLRPHYCNLEDSVRRAVQAVQSRPEFRRIGISVWHEGECEGWFDPVRLDRVFHNLLLNACEAVPQESGLIEVRFRRLEGGVEIRVADNGPGIPEPIRDSVFHPFVSYGKENGTGLGLAVVQKMVEDHGGVISIEHTGGDGTIFKVVLPHNAPPMSAGEAAAPAAG